MPQTSDRRGFAFGPVAGHKLQVVDPIVTLGGGKSKLAGSDSCVCEYFFGGTRWWISFRGSSVLKFITVSSIWTISLRELPSTLITLTRLTCVSSKWVCDFLGPDNLFRLVEREAKSNAEIHLGVQKHKVTPKNSEVC